jgi:hypothetical protein
MSYYWEYNIRMIPHLPFVRPMQTCVRATSHYGQRSRGHRFPPIKLQETKSSASWPFTLEAKVQRPSFSKMPTWQYFLTIKRPLICFIKKPQPIRSWPLDQRGCFVQGKKWDASSFFGLWAWLHTLPGRRQFLYFIDYFQPMSLYSQQNLAIQSTNLSNRMAIVWSGP